MAKMRRYTLVDFEKELTDVKEPSNTFPGPIHVLFGEAVDVARFFAAHWRTVEDDEGEVVRFGLDTMRSRLPARTGAEILSLVELAQDAQTRYRLAVRGPTDVDTVGRASFLVSELDAALAYLFDDGIEDEKDVQLARLRDAHAATGDSVDAIAQELREYATLADRNRQALDGFGGFDAALIDEAAALVRPLLDRPANAAMQTEEARKAIALRNGLLELLQRRVGLVRAAARYVYRHEPATVRKATSAFERRRRRAARANAQAQRTATNADAQSLSPAGDDS
ncbi:MAG: hypothetical protein H6729_09900 [Deltaproteobacteria bacterium]|nr:hypothetical protein [Deltaproteobacteria bacterium]